MSDDVRIHSLSNLTEEELEEAQEELEILIRAELEWREECAEKKVDEDTLPERKY